MSMTIRCKPNVYPFGVHPRIRYAILVMAQEIHNRTGKECVITSLVDGRHRPDSYHYLGGGVDLRSRHLTPDEKREVLRAAKATLEEEFDLILEGEGQPHEHYHLEYDNNKPGEDSSRIQLQRRLDRAQQDFVDAILDPNSP